MAFGLSFSEEFFGSDDDDKSHTPTTVYSALKSLPERIWEEICQEVFAMPPDNVTIDMVIDRIKETDTCSDLSAPVEVWIDEDGYYTITVYESKETD